MVRPAVRCRSEVHPPLIIAHPGWLFEILNLRTRNYSSYPRWVYHVPFVGVLHVFEMPLLGYLVFAWELHALYHLVVGPFGRGASVLRIGHDASGQHGCPDRGGVTYHL
jgi:hypothetical protein